MAIDTGAGATILAPRVAMAAGVVVNSGQTHRIAGLSGILNSKTANRISIRSLAIGDRENVLPSNGSTLTADIFPRDVDGVIDPTESYSPLGYVIDFSRREISSFDPSLNPLRLDQAPIDGAVVSWLHEAAGRRPYVRLDDGQKALLDTGSEFGLALRDDRTMRPREGNSASRYRPVNDVGGGTITARRVAPITVAIGSLALQNIPTDLVSGLETGAPVLLGRAALRPFRIRFDPVNRLIEIAPAHAPGYHPDR